MTPAENDIVKLYARIKIDNAIYDRRQKQVAAAQSQRAFFKKCMMTLLAITMVVILFV